MVRSRVVLPIPEYPIIAILSPELIVRLISLTNTLEYPILRFSNLIIPLGGEAAEVLPSSPVLGLPKNPPQTTCVGRLYIETTLLTTVSEHLLFRTFHHDNTLISLELPIVNQNNCLDDFGYYQQLSRILY